MPCSQSVAPVRGVVRRAGPAIYGDPHRSTQIHTDPPPASGTVWHRAPIQTEPHRSTTIHRPRKPAAAFMWLRVADAPIQPDPHRSSSIPGPASGFIEPRAAAGLAGGRRISRISPADAGPGKFFSLCQMLCIVCVQCRDVFSLSLYFYNLL